MKNVNLFTFNRSEAQKNTLCASVNVSNASPRDDRDVTETLPRRYGWAKLAATLTLLLTLGVGQMWANGGIGYKGVKFTKNGVATGWYNIHDVSWDYSNASYECRSGQSGVTDFNNASLGTVTTLKFKAFVVIGWTDEAKSYVAGQLKYRLYKQGASAPSYSTYNVGNYGNNSYGAYDVLASSSNNRVVGKNAMTTDIVTSSTPAGNYYLQLQGLGRVQWSENGYSGDYNPNNGSEVKATLLVPGFTTTSTSNDYGSVAVGSNSSTTISFTQHYGTALTTSDCSLTNETDFEVTAISETGVTVKYKPQTAGDKSCTLTITDANSKTCTITLTGTTPAGLTVVAGTGISAVTGSDNDISAGDDIDITATVATGYTWDRWTLTGSGTLSTFTATTKDQTVTVGTAANMTLTASATENTHNVTVQYRCSTATIKDATTKSNVGEVTATTQAAPAIDGYTFSTWTIESGITKTSGNLTDNTLNFKTNASGTYTITANYTAKSCNLVKLSSGRDGSETTTGTDAGAMTFDPTTKAYYIDITTTASPYYFRFTYNSSTKYCSDWKDSNYDKGKEVAANTEGSMVACDQSVGGWTNKPAMYYPGATGSKLRVWFDYQNKKVWTTASLNEQYVLRGSTYANDATLGGMPGWSATTSFFDGLASGNTGTIEVTLLAGTKYKLKAYDMFNAAWKGNNLGSGTQTMADNTLYTIGSGDNFVFTSTAAGPYTFTLDKSSGLKIKVQFPTSYQVDFSAETFVNGGASHSTSTTGGTLSAVDGNSTTFTSGSKIISGGTVVITATKADGYTFDGFYTNAACTTAVSGAGVSISDNVLTLSSINAAKTVYAKFSENMTSVSLVASPTGKGTFTKGGAAVTSVSAGKTTKPEVTAVPATGYRVNTSATVWAKNNSNITLSSTTANPVTVTGCGTVSTSSTLTATFTPKTYTITLNNHGATTTGTTSVTATFDANTNISSNISVPGKTGYAFGGYWTGENGTGTMLINASGAWQTNNAWINSTGKWVNDGNVELHAKWTANPYTVSFDKNGGSGATPGNITVTYGQAYGTLPAGPTPPGADQFVGWFTAQTGGTQVTSSTIVSTASDHTLWARFEHTYTVNVQYKCVTDVLRAQTTTHASETSVAAEITAPVILGYEFVEWTGSNATFADPTSASTTVNVTSATTIVANYEVVPMVYFKNNLDWDDVYVTFDCYFKDWSGQQVPGNKDKPYYKMTRLGTSDIFYCVIPSEYTDNNYANWAWNIAFDNKGFGDYEIGHEGTFDPFYQGEFLGRADFDPNATMYIPYNGDEETRNEGTYYPTGCWLQYNTTYSGYKINVWNSVSGNSGNLVRDVELRAEVAGSFEFTATGWLDNSADARGLKLYKDIRKNNNEKWYTNVNNEANTITSATTTLPWSFVGAGSDENWQRCRILPEVSGDYIFTVSFATGRPMVNIEYPVTVGDFRLVYKDQATWNTTHDASWQQISPVFKHKANRVDTASFFISYGSSPTLELQKCIDITGGVETWTMQGSNIPLSSISSKGVYNFTVTQNSTGSSATAAYLGAYTGKYYVRTDASDGGWNNYKSSANAMTYTEYSMDHGGSSGPYSYYFMRHVNEGQNIKFVVANDYSACLTDTLIDDTYAHEWIEHEANIRFTYNHENNEVHRAYISGSSIISDRFLVLEGDDKLFDADGHPLTGTYQVAGLNEYEMNFTDDQNWIYETTVQAKPNERVKLTAKFNGKIQYFYGAEGERSSATTYQLIGGTGATMYKMRVVYDFKTNRLLAAWLPNGDISSNTPINADVMIIRYHQDDAQQITFSGSGKLTDVKTVYGAMRFNKYRLNNQNETGGHGDLGLSPYERDLFFISFPFDVKLNDVFGFGQYGKHWIIEYYDGKTRAQNGYWKDSPTNWKFVTKAMKDSYTLKANEGYVLALDLDELKPESPVWNYDVQNVYLYFPSTATVNNIQATSATVKIDTVGYQCKIHRNTPNGDRRVKDSHWHLIGVPSYANANHSTSTSWNSSYDGDLDQTIYYPNQDPDEWTSAMPYVYLWDAAENKFNVNSSASMEFKAMQAYLVQYARDTIQWRQINATVPASVAARRNANYKSEYNFRLEMTQDSKEVDHTFISLRDNDEITSGFDFNYDLCKMLYGGFTSPSNLYTIIDGDVEAAGNCLPLSEQTTIIPVGLVLGESGEYTFAMPDGTEGLNVVLVDNETGIHTSLAWDTYTVALEAGTHDGRFTIVIDPRTSATTVDNISGEGGDAARKVFINGLMYIQRGNALYDTTGRKVE